MDSSVTTALCLNFVVPGFSSGPTVPARLAKVPSFVDALHWEFKLVCKRQRVNTVA